MKEILVALMLACIVGSGLGELTNKRAMTLLNRFGFSDGEPSTGGAFKRSVEDSRSSSSLESTESSSSSSSSSRTSSTSSTSHEETLPDPINDDISSQIQIVCMKANGKINCGERLINIVSAFWERTEANTCGKHKATDCKLDVITYMRPLCDNKTSCEFVPRTSLLLKSLFGRKRPCKGLGKYLKINHTCEDPDAPTTEQIATTPITTRPTTTAGATTQPLRTTTKQPEQTKEATTNGPPQTTRTTTKQPVQATNGPPQTTRTTTKQPVQATNGPPQTTRTTTKQPVQPL